MDQGKHCYKKWLTWDWSATGRPSQFCLSFSPFKMKQQWQFSQESKVYFIKRRVRSFGRWELKNKHKNTWKALMSLVVLTLRITEVIKCTKPFYCFNFCILFEKLLIGFYPSISMSVYFFDWWGTGARFQEKAPIRAGFCTSTCNAIYASFLVFLIAFNSLSQWKATKENLNLKSSALQIV